MEKIFYNKLIRDKIPEVIKNRGSEFETRELSDAEFEKELLKKVSEEAQEVSSAGTREDIVREIADVIDVIEEIKELKQISVNDIETARKAMFDKKGGFKKRLFLIWSADDGYKSKKG